MIFAAKRGTTASSSAPFEGAVELRGTRPRLAHLISLNAAMMTCPAVILRPDQFVDDELDLAVWVLRATHDGPYCDGHVAAWHGAGLVSNRLPKSV